MERLGLKIGDFDVIELNEAFASPVARLPAPARPSRRRRARQSNGGAIALGHPLGMSGARLALTALHALESAAAARSRHHVRWRGPGGFARDRAGLEFL